MSAAGKWMMSMQTPMGLQTPEITLRDDGTGVMVSPMGEIDITQVVFEGSNVTFSAAMHSPMGDVSLEFSGTADGDAFEGTVKTPMGDTVVTGERSAD